MQHAPKSKHQIDLNTTLGPLPAEYKEHTYVKFPYVYLNIVVYKPGKCEARGTGGKHYADAIITIGKSARDPLTEIGYDDLPIIKEAIDAAIDVLNSENDGNNIDKLKVTDFDDII